MPLFNRNGARLCDAHGCRKHVRLVFDGTHWLCPAHGRQLRIQCTAEGCTSLLAERFHRSTLCLFHDRPSWPPLGEGMGYTQE